MAGQYVPPPDGRATQHDGTEHLAVNNTRLRRLLTRLALKTTGRYYGCMGPVIPISKHLIVKTGFAVHLTEVATIQFVAKHTSIPVPRIHCAFVHKNEAYIVMERIQGKTIAHAFAELSEADREIVFDQLRTYMKELRALKPPEDHGIQSCIGGSLRDSRISRSRPRFGPFKTTQDFHLWLRDGLQLVEGETWGDPEEWEAIKRMVAMQDQPFPPPVFTHGDLNPFNIMVRGNRVVAIIDWEFAGWYPPYWEYTAAWYGNLTRLAWQGVIDRFLDPYPAELKMEITRQRWYGE